MKKLFFYMIASTMLLASCGKEKKFDENLRMAYIEMAKTFSASVMICSETAGTWHKAIYENKTPSGKYCKDFDDAITELYDEYNENGVLDSLSGYKNKMEIATSKLNNPPSSRKDCYNDFVEIISEVSSLTRIASNPSGSYNSYNEQINEKAENISKKIDQFKIKYAEYIKFGEE